MANARVDGVNGSSLILVKRKRSSLSDDSNKDEIIRNLLAQLKSPNSPPFCNLHHCEAVGNKFLNTMKQTHEKFSLGAVAELIDNSREAAKSDRGVVEPVELRIEKESGGRALSFSDNGKGMDYKTLYLMLKPGKGTKGQDNFGYGFKTGTMGLGGEALVLTNDGRTRSLAFFSRSTNKIDAGVFDDLCVPFAFWHPDGLPATSENPLLSNDDTKHNPLNPMLDLKQDDRVDREVLSHIYNSPGTVISHFEVLQSEFRKIERGGTRILVWMLHEAWSFDDDDITVPEGDGVKHIRADRHGDNFPAGVDVPPDYSLRSYCQLLYLQGQTNSSFKIFILGKEVTFKIFILGKEVTFKDPMSPFYLSDVQEFTFELQEKGHLPRPITLTLALAYSPRGRPREGRFGCHIYWDDKKRGSRPLWRDLQLAPRLVQPYVRQGTHDRARLYNRVHGALAAGHWRAQRQADPRLQRRGPAPLRGALGPHRGRPQRGLPRVRARPARRQGAVGPPPPP